MSQPIDRNYVQSGYREIAYTGIVFGIGALVIPIIALAANHAPAHAWREVMIGVGALEGCVLASALIVGCIYRNHMKEFDAESD